MKTRRQMYAPLVRQVIADHDWTDEIVARVRHLVECQWPGTIVDMADVSVAIDWALENVPDLGEQLLQLMAAPHRHLPSRSLNRELRKAFPHPPRENHPYRIWRDEVRIQLGQKPEPPGKGGRPLGYQTQSAPMSERHTIDSHGWTALPDGADMSFGTHSVLCPLCGYFTFASPDSHGVAEFGCHYCGESVAAVLQGFPCQPHHVAGPVTRTTPDGWGT